MPILEFKVPLGFDLTTTVFSYGWALLSPNTWKQVDRKTNSHGLPIFFRPLHNSSGEIVYTNISQSTKRKITVEVEGASLTDADREDLEVQVCRMLRLNVEDEEVVKGFQKLHSKAHKERFGRLLRSPTIWEDLVKCILLCNCGWGRTISMNKALCEVFGSGAFPQPLQIANANPIDLQQRAGLGYRAKNIVKLAQQVVEGDVDLEQLEHGALSDHELLKELQKLPGIGPFSAANMLQLLGRYERIACDSETIRHLKSQYNMTECTASNVASLTEKVYESYRPYQFLAYWHELWRSYEQLRGPFALLSPAEYNSFTGSNMKTISGGVKKRTKGVVKNSAKRISDTGDLSTDE